MNVKTFTSLLIRPELLNKEHLSIIENIMEAFPYFQAPKALYLKGLYNEENFRYNTELKVTAAYTNDRTVLFDFITSKAFHNNTALLSTKQEPQKNIKDITVTTAETLNTLTGIETKTSLKTKPITTSAAPSPLASEKEWLQEKNKAREETSLRDDGVLHESLEKLTAEKPLMFDQNELHSFGEWLKLTALKPIQRTAEKTVVDTPLDAKERPSEKTKLQEKKFEIIDRFISNNPKIGPVSEATSSRNLAIENSIHSESLMTETLAKVYIAQKNYKKAIQAYNILILKNPEKSGFFADQIRAIQNLQDNQ